MTSSVLRPVRGSAREIHAALQRWWDASGGPVTVRTSGSTGAPRDVVLSHAALTASVRAAQARLGGPGQWVLDLPPTYVAGLQVLVRSIAAGLAPVVAAEHESLRDAVGQLWGGRCFTSLVPTQLHRMAATGELGPLGRFDAVLVGGAALDAELRRRCEDAGVQVVETYGLSETSGGCVYDGHPLDGVGVRIGSDGLVELAGPVLFDGYEGDPTGTAEVLRDGWLLTNDVGELDHDSRLRIVGRIDEVVVSGGVNVPLPAVTAALRRLPGVNDAAAVGVADPEWGARVVACIATTHGVPVPSLSAVRDFCADVLPRSWAPQALVSVEALPLLANGKVDRARLQSLAAGDADVLA